MSIPLTKWSLVRKSVKRATPECRCLRYRYAEEFLHWSLFMTRPWLLRLQLAATMTICSASLAQTPKDISNQLWPLGVPVSSSHAPPEQIDARGEMTGADLARLSALQDPQQGASDAAQISPPEGRYEDLAFTGRGLSPARYVPVPQLGNSQRPAQVSAVLGRN